MIRQRESEHDTHTAHNTQRVSRRRTNVFVYACIRVEYNDRAAADIIRWKIFQRAGECVFVMCARPTAGDIPKYWVTLAHMHTRDVPGAGAAGSALSGGRIRLTEAALINFSVSCAPWSRMLHYKTESQRWIRHKKWASPKRIIYLMNARICSICWEEFDLAVAYFSSYSVEFFIDKDRHPTIA